VAQWNPSFPLSRGRSQHAVNTAVAKEIQNWEEEEGIKAAPVIGVSSHVPELRRKKTARPRLSR